MRMKSSETEHHSLAHLEKQLLIPPVFLMLLLFSSSYFMNKRPRDQSTCSYSLCLWETLDNGVLRSLSYLPASGQTRHLALDSFWCWLRLSSQKQASYVWRKCVFGAEAVHTMTISPHVSAHRNLTTGASVPSSSAPSPAVLWYLPRFYLFRLTCNLFSCSSLYTFL